MYDARIGRWISPDRARQHYSPYLAMSNSPHMYIDPTGLVDWNITFKGAFLLTGGVLEASAGVGYTSGTGGAGAVLGGAFLITDGIFKISAGFVMITHGLIKDPNNKALPIPTSTYGLTGKAADKTFGTGNKLETTFSATGDIALLTFGIANVANKWGTLNGGYPNPDINFKILPELTKELTPATLDLIGLPLFQNIFSDKNHNPSIEVMPIMTEQEMLKFDRSINK